MSINQPRGFHAATDVLAFMQAFTTASIARRDVAAQPSRAASHQWGTVVRRQLATRSRRA